MRYFPVFIDLKDRPVLIFGGGEPALNKLRLVQKAGARVRIVTDHAEPELAEAAAAAGYSIEHRAHGDVDLAGSALVIACAGDPVDSEISARAMRAGIPVNVVDRTELCSFITPSIVDRGTVVVAIGTEGAAPVLARRLRARIEALLPARLGQLADLIGSRRPRLAEKLKRPTERRAFWEEVVDGPIGTLALDGQDAAASRALDERIHGIDGSSRPRGVVTLVGAGPGDPELLTLKALRAMQDADIIFHDDLVTPEILDLARRDAERVSVGKRAGRHCAAQPDINEALARAAERGLRVVRLKGGDPFVFGRGGEEVEHLRARGIDVVAVPGITAALGCAAALDLPLTHRGVAGRLTMITAHRAVDAEAIDWHPLADRDATLAVYMGRSSAHAVAEGLIAAGRAAQTPAAVIARGTRPDMATAFGTLRDLSRLVDEVGEGPVLLVLGEVVRHARDWNDIAVREPELATA